MASKKKFGLKQLLAGATIHRGGGIMLFGGPILIVMALNQYWDGASVSWMETQAKLSGISLHERVFSEKEKINFYKMEYEFLADDKKYQIYAEEILFGGVDSLTVREEIKRDRGLKSIYYDADNPVKSTFIKAETEPEKIMLWSVIFTALIMMGIGYWLCKVTYFHFRT